MSAQWTSPPGFAPAFYFRLALAIARLDDGAIRAASLDRRALQYGLAIWLLGHVVTLGLPLAKVTARRAGGNWAAFPFVLVVSLLIAATLVFSQYSVCHALAKWIFGGTGTYVRLLRGMFMGSLVTWLFVIPAIGPLVGGLWGVAILMCVFEEVEGIERLKAFILASVVGFSFLILGYFVFRPK